MALGFGPISGSAISSLSTNFKAEFDVEKRIEGLSGLELTSYFSESLIKHFQKHPNDLKVIDRRKFEELVAELFSGFGFEVELTQQTRDGGKDIIAIQRKPVGVKYLIECKRPEPGNPVSVSVVRELLGVKNDERATKGILVTTTHLSPDAQVFVNKNNWELEAKEFNGLTEWVDEYLRLKSHNSKV